MDCTSCDVLGIVAGTARNEASAKVAEFFLKNTRLPFFTVHLPGDGGMPRDELILSKNEKDEPINTGDIPGLLRSVGAVLISAPTYYEPSAHREIAFWESILPEAGKKMLEGKFGIAIAIGGRHPQEALKALVNFFSEQKVKLYCAIANNGIEDCFKCEVGKICYISDALEHFDPESSIMQDIIATAHFERDDIPECCPGKVQLLPTVQELAKRFGELFKYGTTTP